MKRPRTQTGFTIIELIVALGLFAFVITVSVGALLVLIGANQKEQTAQSVMTNLAFALDSMTREIRTGYGYVCDVVNNGGVNNAFNTQDTSLPSGQQDCPAGSPGGSDKNTAISFIEGGSSLTGQSGAQRIAYILSLDGDVNGDGKSDNTIYRRIGNSATLERLVSSGVRIIDGEFMISDNESLTDGDTEQPTVTIYLMAVDATEVPTETNPDNIPDNKKFTIQTTVTQRELDL